MIQYHRYLSVYKDTDEVIQHPKVTKQHVDWCKQGLINIIDLKLNRDMVLGQWTKTT